ncbi:MAG: Ig-like domain repeat protein, partial [Chloroflexi bacterium]|nr:Ig-like domain repeat protein [Chloroflexota bacterium]
NPYGVAVDSGGNLFIADYENHRIRKVAASTGIITTVAGTGTAGYGGDGGAATSAQLRYPNGVVVDSGGNLFIADSNNHRIRKVDAATQVIITVAGTGEEGFMGVEAGYSGDGGPAASAQLANPSGVALDSAGILFIADRGNNRIRKVEQLDPVPPATVTVSPDLFYGAATAPASFSGTAADDSLGMGLDANSTTFSLQRGSDAKYWTGSAWQSGVAWLATNHNSTTGGAPVNWTSSAAVPAWADGSYTIQAKATDKAGNFATGAAAGFTFDSTAPVITFSPMLGFAGPQKAQQVSWNATDANIAPDSVVLEGFDGTSWLPLASAQPAQGNYSWAVPAVDTSAAKVRVTASDLAGNVNALESGTFVIDSTNPTVSMNDIPGTVSYLQVMAGTSSDSAPGQVDKVQAAVSDNTSGTYWNGAAWVGEETWLETLSNAAGTNWAYIMPALVQDHSYIVKARSLDKSGNMSPLATDNFTFAAAQTSGIPGDANGDGQVNALDITKTERIIAGLD